MRAGNEAGLAIVMGMTAAERAAGRLMRAPDHDAAGGGAVSDAFGGGGAGGEGGGGAPAGGDGGQGGGEPAAWLAGFSAEAIDADTPSHRDWLTSKGFKDPDAMVKSYRETERALRAGGRIELPKDGATAEQVEAFHKAIGRPEKADDYVITLPAGVDGALDDRLIGSFREAAFKAGLPSSMASALGDWYIQQQLDTDAAMVKARDEEVTAKFGEWGTAKEQNLSLANRAATKLGLDRTAIADIQKGLGAGRTLDLMLKLGQGLAEDAMLEGGGRQNFGVTPAEAQTQLNAMIADPAVAAKLMAKDPATIARKDRLEAAIAAEMDRNMGRGAA